MRFWHIYIFQGILNPDTLFLQWWMCVYVSEHIILNDAFNWAQIWHAYNMLLFYILHLFIRVGLKIKKFSRTRIQQNFNTLGSMDSNYLKSISNYLRSNKINIISFQSSWEMVCTEFIFLYRQTRNYLHFTSCEILPEVY